MENIYKVDFTKIDLLTTREEEIKDFIVHAENKKKATLLVNLWFNAKDIRIIEA